MSDTTNKQVVATFECSYNKDEINAYQPFYFMKEVVDTLPKYSFATGTESINPDSDEVLVQSFTFFSHEAYDLFMKIVDKYCRDEENDNDDSLEARVAYLERDKAIRNLSNEKLVNILKNYESRLDFLEGWVDLQVKLSA